MKGTSMKVDKNKQHASSDTIGWMNTIVMDLILFFLIVWFIESITEEYLWYTSSIIYKTQQVEWSGE